VIPTRCVIWGGGIMAAPVAANCGLAEGRGGRVDVNPDLTLPGSDGVYVVGDISNIPGADKQPLPQLGSVALQSGNAAADNILAEFEGKPREDFAYKDKGIMAMIGRKAAIAEVGKNHHEVHGQLAHVAWLGVHMTLMTGTRDKIEAIIDWSWDRFSKTGGPHVLHRGDAPRSIGRTTPRSHRPALPPRDRPGSRRPRRFHDRGRVDRGRPVPLSVRDHVDLPLPVRAAHARPRAAGGDHADAVAPGSTTTPGCG